MEPPWCRSRFSYGSVAPEVGLHISVGLVHISNAYEPFGLIELRLDLDAVEAYSNFIHLQVTIDLGYRGSDNLGDTSLVSSPSLIGVDGGWLVYQDPLAVVIDTKSIPKAIPRLHPRL